MQLSLLGGWLAGECAAPPHHSPTHPPTHSLTPPLTHSLTHFFTHSLTTYPLARSLAHSRTHSQTHFLAHCVQSVVDDAFAVQPAYALTPANTHTPRGGTRVECSCAHSHSPTSGEPIIMLAHSRARRSPTSEAPTFRERRQARASVRAPAGKPTFIHPFCSLARPTIPPTTDTRCHTQQCLDHTATLFFFFFFCFGIYLGTGSHTETTVGINYGDRAPSQPTMKILAFGAAAAALLAAAPAASGAVDDSYPMNVNPRAWVMDQAAFADPVKLKGIHWPEDDLDDLAGRPKTAVSFSGGGTRAFVAGLG